MKKSILIIVAISLLSFTQIFAQKTFKGDIEIKVEINGDIPEEARQAAGDKMSVVVGENKIKVVMGIATTIVDYEANQNITFFDVSGRVMYMKTDISKGSLFDTDSAYKIIKTAETKKISDYNCTKYLVVFTEKSDTTVVYYTEECKYKNMKFAEDILPKSYTGAILEVQMKSEAMGMKMEIIRTVTSFKKRRVKRSEFAIPEDATEVDASTMNY